MILLKKVRLFPRSLRQLVLMAFLLVLLPLLVLAYQAYQSLDHLSSQAADINHTVLADARRSEAMTSIALEMERSYRQYCVLDDVTLATLYQSQRKQYDQMLNTHATILPDTRYYQTLRELFDQLTEIHCQHSEPLPQASIQLEKFSHANAEMGQATRDVIFARGQKLQQDIAARGKFFGWQSLLLFLLSVMLVILFTRMIIDPVKGIERMINYLGEGRSLENTRLFTGPSELRSLAQRILWLSERLAWLESQRHEFLRHISHELKTPLASMREGTALLADEVAGSLTQDQKEIVAILDNSSSHLQQLIEQLLDYNRKWADGSGKHENIQLTTIMDRVIAAHSLPARAKMIRTQVDLQTESCWAEPTLLIRVLDNLYSNAVHYGEGSGDIWLCSRKLGNRIQIDVANSGDAIPLTEKTMIFEPFFQGSHQRKGAVKGSGLGLSIAQDCIKRMQGSLQLVTVDYAAVCFRIELPLRSEN
ncbi:HAMP domain-containing sensor histidine kinase [Candidatus Fukatsuia symbiotica]|uniref:sensor histidine kinase n=1 Tax=Candidatus Fukatsuia TaxID=1927833 RepID=UPI000932927E|nr:HAMP domain-containing sensor histidine kinase [Candidatus Fukatsuia symbiotica]MEA9444759.1 HAMP domain-containing sensor histidine kinase [Candidatus Fukatsuia symbiotica]